VFNPELACLVGQPRPIVLTDEARTSGTSRHAAAQERSEVSPNAATSWNAVP
jgi:hypothetical protein